MNLIFLLKWLFSKDKVKCPRCNYPLMLNGKKYMWCVNCGQPLVNKKVYK